MLENFDSLYKKYGPMVLRRCKYILHDEEKALDAMQDTFIRIWERKENLSEVGASYFYTAATHVCLNIIRTESGKYVTYLDDLLSETADKRTTQGSDFQHEERITSSIFLDSLFAQKDEKTKEIMILHFVDGYTLEETAEKTGFSVSGIRKRIRVFQKWAQKAQK